MKRTSFIKLLTGAVVSTITLNSCGKNQPAKLVYDYEDTDEFYEKLKSNIKDDIPFKVVCDGSVKITKDCKFLQILQDESNLSKAEIFKSFDEFDKSKEGRQALSKALAPELIKHRKPTAQEIAHVQKEHKDNLVLEPLTLFLIISLVVISVAAHGAETNQFGSAVRINTPVGGIEFEFKPVP